MEKLIDLISEQVSAAFEAAGYDPALGRVSVSARPDLCEYQCNGAMPAAKQYHKAPIVIVILENRFAMSLRAAPRLCPINVVEASSIPYDGM